MKHKQNKLMTWLLALSLVLLFPFPSLLWLAYKITSVKYVCLSREFGCGANDYGFMVLDTVFLVWVVLTMIWAVVVAFSVVLFLKSRKDNHKNTISTLD